MCQNQNKVQLIMTSHLRCTKYLHHFSPLASKLDIDFVSQTSLVTVFCKVIYFNFPTKVASRFSV